MSRISLKHEGHEGSAKVHEVFIDLELAGGVAERLLLRECGMCGSAWRWEGWGPGADDGAICGGG